MINDFNVGDRIQITPKSLTVIKNCNRSCTVHPCDSFVQLAENNVGIPGTVTHRFRPGYEMTVRLDNGQGFHMKDNWVERI